MLFFIATDSRIEHLKINYFVVYLYASCGVILTVVESI